MLFLRTASINAASLNVASRSQVCQGPRAHNPCTEEKVCAVSSLWYSSRRYVHLPENVQKLGEKSAAVGYNANL